MYISKHILTPEIKRAIRADEDLTKLLSKVHRGSAASISSALSRNNAWLTNYDTLLLLSGYFNVPIAELLQIYTNINIVRHSAPKIAKIKKPLPGPTRGEKRKSYYSKVR